jgi:uncharacterized protein YyaL (SSP411 family)
LRGYPRNPQSPEPAHTNHLAGETSPYLLQHAHNPVDWYPWGAAAFERARKEERPIFLSIGYSSCHWCHVMERESFEDEGIAKLLNEQFVCIKVDREERPDLDEIYLTAVQLLNDGSAGWPASLFLTPDGKPFFGGTYYPRDAFAELLRKVGELWKDAEKRKQAVEQAERVVKAIGQAMPAPAAGSISLALIPTAVTAYMGEFDAENGGFGSAPKFPPAMRLALMLREQRRKPDPKLLKQILTTLDRMARGGIYDQVSGGFHRYSTDAKWLVPHFEKMLYDNALLAWVYFDAAQLTRRPALRRTGGEILDFVLRELADPKGGFYSTLDADSAAGEGGYYLWKPEEVIEVLGPVDGELFNRIYDVTPAGNFEGRSIPNLLQRPVEEWAREMKVSPEALWKRLDGMRSKLRAARSKRPRPALDDKVLVNWNGLMLRALAAGYRVTGEARYLEAARKNAGFLLAQLRREGNLLHVYRAGTSKIPGYLEDYAFLTVGLLDLYGADHDPRWIRESQNLVEAMNSRFWDEASGTYYSTGGDHEQLLVRTRSAEDNATPSGQSMAALALVRLAHLTGNRELGRRARRVLDAYALPMKRTPAAFPTMLLATHLYLTEPAAAPAGQPDPVRLRVAAAPSPVLPGREATVALQVEVAPGWHINAAQPATADLIPTRLTLDGGPFRLVDAVYPPAKSVTLSFATQPLLVYEGTVSLRARLAISGAARPGRQTVRLTLHYQPCSNQACLVPAEKSVSVPLRVLAARTFAPRR